MESEGCSQTMWNAGSMTKAKLEHTSTRGHRTSDWESRRGEVTDDESKISARLDDHLKDSEMESEVKEAKNPWYRV